MDSPTRNQHVEEDKESLGSLGYNISEPSKVSSFARRVHGWSWQAFPVGMGTGAVYVALAGLKQHSRGLTVVESIFFFLAIILFLTNVTTLLLQAIFYPKQAWRNIQHPAKGIFVPLVVLSFATIIIGTINYTIPPHLTSPNFIYVLFWIYVAASIIACFPMLMIWFNQKHDLRDFTPAYAFLIFPMMLVGVVAFNVLKVLDPSEERAVGVLLAGYFFQGLGFFMTFFYLCIYIIRIMQTGFLDGHQANGAFVACGPPGFTALALINLGDRAREIFEHRVFINPHAGEIWYASSVMAGLMLWGLAVFFFFFGLMPYWSKVDKHLSEILGFWALTFPNVGWIATTKVLGDIFDIHAFYLFNLIFVVALCCTWLVLFVFTIIALWQGKIFYSSEDRVTEDTRKPAQKVVEEEKEGHQESGPLSPHVVRV